MNETQLLKGRPNGGAVIIWKGSLKANVTPVKYYSTGVCVVTVELGDTRVLIVCVYMPYDDNTPNHNILDYNIALDDIKTICNSVNVQNDIVGDDFNTDLNRNSYFTRAMCDYVINENLYFCVKNACSTVKSIYYSKCSKSRSLIDHFVISENMGGTLSSYNEVDCHDNLSDHSAVKYVLDVKVTYTNRTSPSRDNNCRPAWSKASEDQLYAYKSILKDYLCYIIIPKEAVLCNNKICKVHHKDICDYHDVIILCMINVCKESIPTHNYVNNIKTVPG